MWVRHKTIIIAQYLLGIVSLPWILSSDLSHHDIKPKDEGCTEKLGPLPRQPPSRGSARDRRGEAPDSTAPSRGPSITRRAARARPAADPLGVRGARRLQTRPAPAPRRLPAAAARRLRAPSRLSPRRGRAEPGGQAGAALGGGGRAGAGGDGAAIVPLPLPGAQAGRAGRLGRRGDRAVREPVRPAAGRLSSPAAVPRPGPLRRPAAPPL